MAGTSGAGASSGASPPPDAAAAAAASASASAVATALRGPAVGRGGAGGGEDDDLLVRFQALCTAMNGRMRTLNQQEQAIRQAEAALSASYLRLAALSSRPRSDLISLNVGGTPLAASRRTLTSVPDSLLGTMFGGAWDEHLQRDECGRVFLDADPSLFCLVLNWLRAQDMGGPEAPLGELGVEAGREEQLLVLIDFLQLQRHVPCRFTETFSPSLSSPFLSLAATAAWRTAAGSAGDYAAAATSHAFFDVDLELTLEVLRFGAVSRPEPGRSRGGGGASSSSSSLASLPPHLQPPNHPMFVGVVARGQLAGLDQSQKRANASWQSTCHGWWTRRRESGEVRGGRSTKLKRQVLWSEGDCLLLTLEAAKHPHRVNKHTGQPLPPTDPAPTQPRQPAQPDRPPPADPDPGQPRQPGPAPPGGAGGAGGAGDPPRAEGEGGRGGRRGGRGRRGTRGAGAGGGRDGEGPWVATLSLTNTRTAARLTMDISADCLEGFEEQWVVVVGLAGRGDEVRINTARRRGAKPRADSASEAAAAVAAALRGGGGGARADAPPSSDFAVGAAAATTATEEGGAGGQGGGGQAVAAA